MPIPGKTARARDRKRKAIETDQRRDKARNQKKIFNFLVGFLLIGRNHTAPFQRGFDKTDHVVESAERTDKTAEDPAQKKGHEKNAERPSKTFDPEVPGQQRGQPDKGVDLKEKGYGVFDTDVLFAGNDQRIVKIDILGQPAFHQKIYEQNQKEGLAYPSQPDQVLCFQTLTFLIASLLKSEVPSPCFSAS